MLKREFKVRRNIFIFHKNHKEYCNMFGYDIDI